MNVGMCWISFDVIVPPIFAVAVSTADTVSAETFTVVEVPPSSSWILIEFACSGIIVTFCKTLVANPAAVAVRVKRLGGRAPKLYTPSALEVVFCVAFVELSVSVTWAFGINAPVESVTLP